MNLPKIKFWLIRTFNMNNYFRKHFTELEFDYFYIQHKAHFSDHLGYREKVSLHEYDDKKKEMIVKRFNHTNGEKLFIRGVHLSQIFLNPK